MRLTALLSAILISGSALSAEEFHLSAHSHLLNELPTEVRDAVERINPRVQIVSRSKDFYGSYNGRKNILTFNEPVMNDSQKFKRTLFHELAHLYDQHVKSVSTDPIFQTAFGGRIDSYNRLHLENLVPKRTPDHYENENERELFAVNFEHFLLDENYKCRRPLQYEYLRNLFGNFDPPGTTQCSETLPFLKMELTDAKLIQIDPKKLYRIDYLLASPAKNSVAGGFGHAMLRLALCSPERQTVSEACLNDQDHHLVITFRASVNDEQISSVKGLKGSYPSNLYVMPYKSVIEEYTKVQYRDLTAYPLKLSKKEKTNLLKQMSLQQWSLERKYYFITNNCASEIVNLFRSVLGRSEMFAETPFKPLQLTSWFRSLQLLDDEGQETLKSAMDYWQKSIDLISPKKKIKFTKFIELPFAKRNEVYSEALTERPSPKIRALIRLVEFKILSRLQQLYASNLEEVLREEKGYDSTSLRELLGLRNPGWIIKNGYGIPSPEEQEQVTAYLENRERELQNEIQTLQSKLDKLKNVKSKELLALEEKIKFSKDFLQQ